MYLGGFTYTYMPIFRSYPIQNYCYITSTQQRYESCFAGIYYAIFCLVTAALLLGDARSISATLCHVTLRPKRSLYPRQQ